MVSLNYTDYVQCSNTRKKRWNDSQPLKFKNHELQSLAREIMKIKEGNKTKPNPTKTHLLGSPFFAIAALTLRVHLSHVLKHATSRRVGITV